MKETIKQFITQELMTGHQNFVLKDDDNLLLDGIVDSLGTLRLVAFIEDTFPVRIPYQDITIENFCTVTSLTTYLQQQRMVMA
jgi:acyl carrier protein